MGRVQAHVRADVQYVRLVSMEVTLPASNSFRPIESSSRSDQLVPYFTLVSKWDHGHGHGVCACARAHLVVGHPLTAHAHVRMRECVCFERMAWQH